MIMKKEKGNEHPATVMIREDFGWDRPKVVGSYFSHRATLGIASPEMVQDLYGSKNKYLDKHRQLRDILYPLMGDSILFSPSTEGWSHRRKSLSGAFYKDKLIKMVEIVKGCMSEKVDEWREKFVNKDMDLILETSRILVKVILSCTFGEEFGDSEIEFYQNGIKTKGTVAMVVRELFNNLVKRQLSIQLLFFPSSTNWYLTPRDRENKRNIDAFRKVLAASVQKRREAMKKEPNNSGKGDLLSILLTDE